MKPVRVLIVDRNPEVRRALAARLGSASNIEVLTTAAAAREAFPQISALGPQVVLMDSRSFGRVPRSRELEELVRALRRIGSGIIVLSTYSDEQERQTFLQAGVQRYLLKDIDSASLIAVIHEVAAQHPLPAQRE